MHAVDGQPLEVREFDGPESEVWPGLEGPLAS
jgi:hypothetical protein